VFIFKGQNDSLTLEHLDTMLPQKHQDFFENILDLASKLKIPATGNVHVTQRHILITSVATEKQ